MLHLLLGTKFAVVTGIVMRVLESVGVKLRGQQIKLPKKTLIFLPVLLVVMVLVLPALFGGGGTNYAKLVGNLADSMKISLSAFSKLTPEIENAQNKHVRARILSHGDEMCSLETEQTTRMQVVVADESCRPGATECTLVAQGLDEDGSVINVYPYPASGVMLTAMSDIHAALLAYVTNLEKITQAETIEEAKTTRFAAFGAAEAAARAVRDAATGAIEAAAAKAAVARLANMTAKKATEDALTKADNAEKFTGQTAGSIATEATEAVDTAISAAKAAADKIRDAATAEAARAAASAKAVEVVEAAEEATAKAIEAVEEAEGAGNGEPSENSDGDEGDGNGRPLAEAGVSGVDKNSVAEATDAAAVEAAATEAAGVAAAEAAEGAVAKVREVASLAKSIDEDDVTLATRLTAYKAGRIVEDAVSEATEAALVAAAETARESTGTGVAKDIAAEAAQTATITKVAVEAVVVKTTEAATVAVDEATEGARKAEEAAAMAVKAAAGDARAVAVANAAAAAARAAAEAAEAVEAAQAAAEVAEAVAVAATRAADVRQSITDNLDGQTIPLKELRNIPYVGGMFANVIEVAVVHHVDRKKKDYLAEVTRGTQNTLDILGSFYEETVIVETTHALKTMHDSFLCEQERFNNTLTLDRFVAYVAAAKKYDAALKAVVTNPFKPFAEAHEVLKDQLNGDDDQPDGKVITLSNVFAALQKFRADALSFEDIVSVLPNRAEPYGEKEADDGGG